jgi:hypothetical protein
MLKRNAEAQCCRVMLQSNAPTAMLKRNAEAQNCREMSQSAMLKRNAKLNSKLHNTENNVSIGKLSP